ncbi:outer membrane protein assembly factor BamD [Gallaecimonas sp. GXIMD4217]|uniref:outer membrane protein assembly factor BamD n=1 Tax=Gallaecimonas sp. GXIMD4217 TaxID=3131927 RepID=UPI00311B4073
MMRSIKGIRQSATLLACAVLMAGCAGGGSQQPPIPQSTPQKLFEQAQGSLASGNVNRAVEVLEAMDSRYPFGPYSHQVQLNLIYAYYKQGDHASAVAVVDRFTRLNPQHPHLDYAYYMRGLNHMAMDSNFFQELLWVDRSDRDPTASRQAFEDFARLIKKFPSSKYAGDAQKRMQFLKNRLANYELAVARYYIKRKAWVAVANRAQHIVENYQGTPAMEKALELLVQSYEELGIDELKENALKVLRENYPNNSLVL